MRLICPNCDAQYEVSDTAIPVGGRDVQCSNCGHAWFQLPPEVEAEQAAEAALFDAPEAEAPPAAPVTAPVPDRTIIAPIPAPPPLPPVAEPIAEPVAEPVADTVAEAVAEAAPATNPVQRQIDDSVLNVLREEAEREMIARRLDAQAIETQQELGIDSAVAAMVNQDATARHLARLKGENPDAPPAPVAPAVTPPPSFAQTETAYEAPLHEAKRELTRRERLPDIEEINSTLRPGDVAMGEDGQSFEIVQRPAGRSSFRSGFVLMLVLAVAVIALYVMAPALSEQIPGAKPALDSYVAGVDAARSWLDTATQGLVTTLRGFAGNDAP